MAFTQAVLSFSAVLLTLDMSRGQQLKAVRCGATVNCFKSPQCTSSSNCDYFVQFSGNKSTNMVSIAIGGKHNWIAFGLRDTEKLTMDGVIGETCLRDGSAAKLVLLRTIGKSATFSPATGLVDVTTSVVNGSILCRYKRPVATPNGTALRSLASSWYLTTAFGNSIVSGKPQYHGHGNYAGSLSRVDMTKVGTIASKNWEISPLLLVHGIAGTLAWGLLSGVGIFIARYMKAALGDKIWFPAHRFTMMATTLSSIICVITIMVSLKGWNAEYAGAHAYIGILVHIFAVIQTVSGNCRPNKTSSRRWIFNIAHRSFGILAFVLGGITILLGCKLVYMTIAPSIIWFVFVFLVVIAMEILSLSQTRRDKNVEVNMDTPSDEEKKELSLSEKVKNIHKGMLILVVLVLFSTALAIIVSLLMLKSNSHGDH